jgi:hypothetical protein
VHSRTVSGSLSSRARSLRTLPSARAGAGRAKVKTGSGVWEEGCSTFAVAVHYPPGCLTGLYREGKIVDPLSPQPLDLGWGPAVALQA